MCANINRFILIFLIFDMFTFWKKNKTPDLILKCSEMNITIKLSYFSENKHLSQHFDEIHSNGLSDNRF